MHNFITPSLPLGFWGYRRFGEQDLSQAVSDWKEAGFTVVLSFVLERDGFFVAEMRELLDLCAQAGLKVILYDDRIHYHRLRESNEAAYRKAVAQSVEQFASHPAAGAFFIGDEPHREDMPYLLKAVEIVNELSPVPAFVNFFPMWRSRDYIDLVGCEGGDVGKAYAPFVEKAGLKCLAYDCYSSMDARDPYGGINGYFDNLNTFYAAAKSLGVPLWTSLLVTRHYAFRQPSLSDLRWQLSTAFAHGVKGVQWFMLYDTKEELGDSPIDIYNEKQPSYFDLKKVNKEYARKWGEILPKLELDEVQHCFKSYGGTRLYAKGCDPYLEDFTAMYRDGAIVSRFTHTETGRTWYMFVNSSQEAGNRFTATFKAPYAHLSGEYWLTAGEMCLIELKA